jgi:hypothetical protein
VRPDADVQQFLLLDGRQRGGHASALAPVGPAISVAIPPPEPAAAARLASVIRCLHHARSLARASPCGHAAIGRRYTSRHSSPDQPDGADLVAGVTMGSRPCFAATATSTAASAVRHASGIVRRLISQSRSKARRRGGRSRPTPPDRSTRRA